MQTTLEHVNEIIELKVRPLLREHGGDLKVIALEGDTLKVRFLGACSGCPGAQMTLEDLVQTHITENIPSIKRVILQNDLSEDMIDFAKKLLNGGKTCTNIK